MTYEMAMIAPAAAAMLLDHNGHPALWFAALLCFTTLAGPFGPLVHGRAKPARPTCR